MCNLAQVWLSRFDRTLTPTPLPVGEGLLKAVHPTGIASMEDLDSRATQALTEIDKADTLDSLDALRVSLLGKSGIITAALKTLGSLSPEEKKSRGAEVNRVKERIADALAARKHALEQAELNRRLASEKLDISLPGRDGERGGIHPITRALERISAIFARLGYQRADGPEIEDDWHNFEALNFPPHHPARAMHDTFYFGDGRLLRTHTSPVQIRSMKGRQPPIRIIAPGKVYRSDSDQTHSPMFHQIEGLAIASDITFADLKGTLDYFAKKLFGEKIRTRFQPSFFPFTEPSGEVSISCIFCGGEGCRVCKESGWIEVMGCGMVHPQVLRSGGIDPEKYTGWAFGLGIDRFAMMKYDINDIQLFFQSDVRFLEQF
jgi:phenylalanyl-tRNA synthetase alpha chain